MSYHLIPYVIPCHAIPYRTIPLIICLLEAIHTSKCELFHWPAQVLPGEEVASTAALKALTAQGLRSAMHTNSDVASAAHLFMLAVEGPVSSSLASSKHAPSFCTYSCGSSAGS